MQIAATQSSPPPAGPVPVQEGSLRVAPLLALLPLLAELGQDPARIVRDCGLDPAKLQDPDGELPYAAVGRLLALAAERTGCAHLGLLAGRRADLRDLGTVGMLARHAPDLGTALRHVVLYLHLHDRGAVPCLWECGDRAILAYTIHQPDVPGTEHIYDAAIAIVYGILKSLAGPGWEADEVRLFRPRPGDVEPYRQQFRTRLSFGASHAAVVFGAGWLARPLGGADALLHARIMQEIQALESQGAGDLIAQLRRVLRRLLIGGRAPGETSLERISKVFAIHRRTLNRRLRERGTSFKALVEEARYDIARQLLRDTRLPVAEVAGALDYADAAAFTRAFRRWSGSTPAAWRAARAAG